LVKLMARFRPSDPSGLRSPVESQNGAVGVGSLSYGAIDRRQEFILAQTACQKGLDR